MMEGFSEAEQCLLRRFLEQILVNIEKIQPEEAIEKLHPDEMTERKEQKRDQTDEVSEKVSRLHCDHHRASFSPGIL